MRCSSFFNFLLKVVNHLLGDCFRYVADLGSALWNIRAALICQRKVPMTGKKYFSYSNLWKHENFRLYFKLMMLIVSIHDLLVRLWMIYGQRFMKHVILILRFKLAFMFFRMTWTNFRQTKNREYEMIVSDQIWMYILAVGLFAYGSRCVSFFCRMNTEPFMIR